MSTADIMAILKRSVFVVVGKEIVYWRLPGPIPTPIPCMSWCLPDLIKDCAKARIHNYRNGGPQPEDHAERLLWEDAWLQEAIRRFDTPNGRPPAHHAAAPAHVRVKRERFTFAKKLASESSRAPIEIATPSPSPSPKRPRGEVHVGSPDGRNVESAGIHDPVGPNDINDAVAGPSMVINPNFLEHSDSDDVLPKVGEAVPDSMERELEQLIDHAPSPSGEPMDVVSPAE